MYRNQVYSRKLYKYELTALHIITEQKLTLHNISLRLFRSVNTLNPKLKFKTILKQVTTTTERSVP